MWGEKTLKKIELEKAKLRAIQRLSYFNSIEIPGTFVILIILSTKITSLLIILSTNNSRKIPSTK